MGDTTGIQWTNKTYNPWTGCLKVSPGCKFCYMYRDKTRYGQDPMAIVRSSPATFNAPLRWKEPAHVFACSWSDWFVEEADDWRDEAWDIVRRTPHLTYQILTKRPERIQDHLPTDWGEGWPNVWLGVSVENQEYADKRIPLLLQMPTAVRWISAEPLLGPLDLRPYLQMQYLGMGEEEPMLSWVIVGGESGPHARPMHSDWVRSLRDQCKAAGVACFVKQAGEVLAKEWGCRDHKGGRMEEWPVEFRVREYPEASYAFVRP